MVHDGYSNDPFSIPNKPIIIMQEGYPTKTPYEYTKQITRESYHLVAHTYNTINNRQPNPPLVIPTSVPNPQPILS